MKTEPSPILEKQTEADFQKLIYNAAHDLQEPVSKIITISEYLGEKLKDSPKALKSAVELNNKVVCRPNVVAPNSPWNPT